MLFVLVGRFYIRGLVKKSIRSSNFRSFWDVYCQLTQIKIWKGSVMLEGVSRWVPRFNRWTNFRYVLAITHMEGITRGRIWFLIWVWRITLVSDNRLGGKGWVLLPRPDENSQGKLFYLIFLKRSPFIYNFSNSISIFFFVHLCM